MPTINKTIQKIEKFADLPKGWRFGQGQAIELNKIANAIRLLSYANRKGIERTNGFALVDGGLLVSFYIDNHTLDLTLENDNSLTIAEDFNDEQITYLENLDLSDAYDKICQFSEYLDLVSESSTQRITTANWEDLKVQPSPPPPTKVSPYLIPPVRLRVAKRSVSTYPVTIPNLQECRPSIGTSQ